MSRDNSQPNQLSPEESQRIVHAALAILIHQAGGRLVIPHPSQYDNIPLAFHIEYNKESDQLICILDDGQMPEVAQ